MKEEEEKEEKEEEEGQQQKRKRKLKGTKTIPANAANNMNNTVPSCQQPP